MLSVTDPEAPVADGAVAGDGNEAQARSGQAPCGARGAPVGEGPKGRRRVVPKPSAALGLVTAKQLSEQLGLPLKWVRREAAEGRLPAIDVGGRYYFAPEAV